MKEKTGYVQQGTDSKRMRGKIKLALQMHFARYAILNVGVRVCTQTRGQVWLRGSVSIGLIEMPVLGQLSWLHRRVAMCPSLPNARYLYMDLRHAMNFPKS